MTITKKCISPFAVSQKKEVHLTIGSRFHRRVEVEGPSLGFLG